MSEATGPVSGSNADAPAPAAQPAPQATPAESRAARRAAGRAAFLAASHPGGEGGAPGTPEPSPSPPPVEAPAESPPPAEPPAEPLAAKEAEEPRADKSLETLQKQRKRQLDEVAAERAAFEADRQKFQAEMAPHVERLQKFDQLRARAKVDFGSVAGEILPDATAEDIEFAARQLYERSKAMKGDPAARDTSAKLLREREEREQRDAMAKRLEMLERQLIDRDAAAAAQSFLSDTAKAVTDETPLVRALLSADAAEANSQLAEIALQMAEEEGVRPDPADVVAELERQEYERIKRRGIDPYAVLKSKTATTDAVPKTQTQPAGETKTAPRTLSSDLGTPTKPRSVARLSKEERRNEAIRALESGRLD